MKLFVYSHKCSAGLGRTEHSYSFRCEVPADFSGAHRHQFFELISSSTTLRYRATNEVFTLSPLIHDPKPKNPRKLAIFGSFDCRYQLENFSGLLRASDQSRLKNEPLSIAKYLYFDGLAGLSITNRRNQTGLPVNRLTIYGKHDVIDQDAGFVCW